MPTDPFARCKPFTLPLNDILTVEQAEAEHRRCQDEMQRAAKAVTLARQQAEQANMVLLQRQADAVNAWGVLVMAKAMAATQTPRAGDVCNAYGDIRLLSGDSLHCGETFVTEEQAKRAAAYGWEVVEVEDPDASSTAATHRIRREQKKAPAEPGQKFMRAGTLCNASGDILGRDGEIIPFGPVFVAPSVANEAVKYGWRIIEASTENAAGVVLARIARKAEDRRTP